MTPKIDTPAQAIAKLYPDWAARIAAYRGAELERDMLQSIIDEAEKLTDHEEWANAAQYAMDTGDYADLEPLIAYEASFERWQDSGLSDRWDFDDWREGAHRRSPSPGSYHPDDPCGGRR